jgi:acyl-CoA reductase-like NAD-dependent aldehyde dehydrogenase
MSELLRGEPSGVPRARMMLQRAHWAATAFATYPADAVARIVEAVAEVAYQNAERYAEWAVRETGMGVVEHKRIKNEVCSRGILETYRDHDYASARIDAERRIVELPRPAGVVLALTPSTNPVCSVYFKVLLSLMTRNAVVVSPHPMARECCVDAARLLADAAVRAGAPDGCIQVVEEPTIPLIEALMSDPATDVIVATGGSAVVRAAYRSGNPAIGVGPGNVPVLVDATADLVRAARCIVDSKAFDSSILCTNESVLIADERIADALERELVKQGAHICSAAEADKLRDTVFPDGHWQLELVGRDAQTIARAADIRVTPRTRVLVAPFSLVVPEEPLAREKLFPVLGMLRVADARRGIDAARAMVRIGGAGHSAVIHSTDAPTIMAFGAAVNVLRVAVNAGGSTGSSGFETSLAPSMTIGTGFFGRSSLGGNLEPGHLVNWTKVAYVSDPAVPFGSFEGLEPWSAQPELVPRTAAARETNGKDDEMREEIRRLVVEELRELMRR